MKESKLKRLHVIRFLIMTSWKRQNYRHREQISYCQNSQFFKNPKRTHGLLSIMLIVDQKGPISSMLITNKILSYNQEEFKIKCLKFCLLDLCTCFSFLVKIFFKSKTKSKVLKILSVERVVLMGFH